MVTHEILSLVSLVVATCLWHLDFPNDHLRASGRRVVALGVASTHRAAAVHRIHAVHVGAWTRRRGERLRMCTSVVGAEVDRFHFWIGWPSMYWNPIKHLQYTALSKVTVEPLWIGSLLSGGSLVLTT